MIPSNRIRKKTKMKRKRRTNFLQTIEYLGVKITTTHNNRKHHCLENEGQQAVKSNL